MLYFDLSAPEDLHTEQELWQELTPVLGQVSLDQGWPKPRGEVLCMGSCYAPRGKQVAAAKIRLKTGPVDKTLNVFGDRYWLTGATGLTTMTRARPFSVMPVDWAHAFGGPDFKQNPLGKGIARVRTEDEQQAIPLPNIEGAPLIGAITDRPPPAGFAPLDLMWPQRAKKNGTYDQKWLKERWPALPDDMNYEFFCLAPEDQFLPGYFSSLEDILIQGMHPDMPVIESSLPQKRMRAFITRRDMQDPENLEKASFEELELRPETLWLFPDRLRGVLLFRGMTRCVDDEYSDVARLFTADEDPQQSPKSLEYYREQQLKKADLSVPFDPAMQQQYQQEMAKAAKKVLNLPKKIKSQLAANQGQAPTMHYSPEDLGRLMDSNLAKIKQTIDSAESTTTDLHSRFGHIVPFDFALFSRFRKQAESMQSKARELVAKGKNIQKQREKLIDKAKSSLSQPELHNLLKQNGLDPQTALDKSEESPFHAQGFPWLVSRRLGLKMDSQRQGQLKDLGLERETIQSRWLAWNPEPLKQRFEDWGLEAEPGSEDFEIPAGLVFPRFKGKELVRLLVRPEPLNSAQADSLVPGSLKEPLFLESAVDEGILVIVSDELAAAYAEQEVGDFAHVAVSPGPAGPLSKAAQEVLKNQALVIVVLPELGDWAAKQDELQKTWPGCFLAWLPKARTIYPPDCGEKDLRQEVLEKLPKEETQKHSLIFDPPGAKKREGAKKLEDILSAASISSQIREGYSQGHAAQKAKFDQRKADLEQRAEQAKARMSQEGFSVHEPHAGQAKRSMTEELNERVAQVEANRDHLKKMGALAPEEEEKYNQAISKMRDLGPKWDQQKSEGMARLQAFEPPPEAKAAWDKAGLDPEKLRPQSLEVVHKAKSGELELKGRTLKDLDLSEEDLSGLDFSEARLDTCILKKARLTGARLDGAMLQKCDFSGAELGGVSLKRTVCKQCVFKQAGFEEAQAEMPLFENCDLSNADFARATLNQAVFQKGLFTAVNLLQAQLWLCIISETDACKLMADRASFKKCVLKKLTMDQASLAGIRTDATLLHSCSGQEVTLAGSDLFKFRIAHESAFWGLNLAGVTWNQGYCRKSNLAQMDMHGSSLERTIFDSCDLEKANLNRSKLVRCRFLKCNLQGADLGYANLHLASLRKSRLVQADMRGANCFAVDFLRTVLGQTQMEGVNLKRSLLAGQEQALKEDGYIR